MFTMLGINVALNLEHSDLNRVNRSVSKRQMSSSPEVLSLLYTYMHTCIILRTVFLLCVGQTEHTGTFFWRFSPEAAVCWCTGRLLPLSRAIKPSLTQPHPDQFRKEWCVHRAPSHWGRGTHTEVIFLFILLRKLLF